MSSHLEEFFKNNQFTDLATLNEALMVAEHFGLKETEAFKTMREPKRLQLINQVLREMAKIPQHMIVLLKARGKTLDLVPNVVTDHPDYVRLKGVQVRGHKEGVTWDQLVGVGGSKTVVAPMGLHDTIDRSSVNLILHEHAHTYLNAFSEQYGVDPITESTFQQLHATTKWKTKYEQDYPEEAWVESFAKYFNGAESREQLRNELPEVYEFFRTRIDRK